MMFKKIEPIKPGLYHFRGKDEFEGMRFHLRVDNEDRGVLIINASRMIILNSTGIEYAMYILQGLRDEEIIRKIKKRYRVKKDVIRRDLKEFKKNLVALSKCEEIVSGIHVNLEEIYKGQNAPYRMDLALTYRCNNNCIHCYNNRRSSEELSTDEWKRVLDILWDLGIPHIVFTGGEPTLRDDLVDLIRHAENNGQITGLNTNGRKLANPKYVEDLINAGLDHIQITIESYRKETHEFITRAKGSYDETLQGIKNALEYGIYLVTNTTIMRENVNEIIPTIEFLRDLGVKHIAANSIIRSGRGLTAHAVDYDELIKILEKAHELAILGGFEFRWYTPTPYCKLNPMELGLGIKSCTACRLNMAIEPNGDVIPCQSYYSPLGNILKDDFKKIWDHDLCKSIRNRDYAPEECKTCPLLGVCGAGCPLSWKAGDYVCLDHLSV